MAEQVLQILGGGPPPDPEDAVKIAKKKVIEANKRYLKFLEATIKFIDELEPKDRLDFAFGISLIVNALHGSINGWEKWCCLKNMRIIKDEEFKKIYPQMKRIMKEWLAIDKEITEAKTKEMEDELGITDDDDGKKPARSKPSKDGSRIYVA